MTGPYLTESIHKFLWTDSGRLYIFKKGEWAGTASLARNTTHKPAHSTTKTNSFTNCGRGRVRLILLVALTPCLLLRKISPQFQLFLTST